MMRSTPQPRLPDHETSFELDRTRKGKSTMQTQYAQRHQVARAGFLRVPASAFPVSVMGIATWSCVNTLDNTTGKPGSPRPPSVSLP